MGLCEFAKYVLLNDDEIVIGVYPTQYVLTAFKNQINDLKEIQFSEKNEDDYGFNIHDYTLYEKYYITCKFTDQISLNAELLGKK